MKTPFNPHLSRWVKGHHGFFVLTQALVIAHANAGKKLSCDDTEGFCCALHECAQLYQASAVAMRLAGDMSSDEYESVRQSMLPPNVPEGFSGLMSRDHIVLVRTVKGLKKDFERLMQDHSNDPLVINAIRTYQAALDAVYKAHRHVCDQTVSEGPSLRGKGSNQSAEVSASEPLIRFRARSLALTGHKDS